MHWQTGKPRQSYIAHPFYGNSGEVPGKNPSYYLIDFDADGIGDFDILKDYTPVQRGSLGRTPNLFLADLSLAYKVMAKKSSLEFSVLVNNIFDSTHNATFDDNIEYSTGILNPDYGKPISSVAPRTVRLGVRWSF